MILKGMGTTGQVQAQTMIPCGGNFNCNAVVAGRVKDFTSTKHTFDMFFCRKHFNIGRVTGRNRNSLVNYIDMAHPCRAYTGRQARHMQHSYSSGGEGIRRDTSASQLALKDTMLTNTQLWY